MYTPPSFRVTDPSVVNSFIQQHSFGLLLTVVREEIHDTHTPCILSADEKFLWGHIAKANPQWKTWGSSTAAKVIFSGPHSYISPSYYVSDFNVPTWNYTSVSISGQLSVVSEENQVVEFIESLTSMYEHDKSIPWALDKSDRKYMQLLASIVVFKVAIADVNPSFKLNQNKSIEDQQSVICYLRRSTSQMDHQVACLMEQNIKGL